MITHVAPSPSASVSGDVAVTPPSAAPKVARLELIEMTCEGADDGGIRLDTDVPAISTCCGGGCTWRPVAPDGALGPRVPYARGVPEVDGSYSDIHSWDLLRSFAPAVEGKQWLLRDVEQGPKALYVGAPGAWSLRREILGVVLGLGLGAGGATLVAIADGPRQTVQVLAGASPGPLPQLPGFDDVVVRTVRFDPSGWTFGIGGLGRRHERREAALLTWRPGASDPVVTVARGRTPIDTPPGHARSPVTHLLVRSPTEVYAWLEDRGASPLIDVRRFDGTAWVEAGFFEGRLAGGPVAGPDGAVWVLIDDPGPALWRRRPGRDDRWDSIDVPAAHGPGLLNVEALLPVGERDVLLTIWNERGTGIHRLRLVRRR